MINVPPDDIFLTITRKGEAKIKEKGSIFRAFAVHVADAKHSDEQLDIWRKEYHDASHIGWARRLAPPPNGEERWSDDGEPHGSTGPPILQAIQCAGLWDVLVGVVRWFGGTKLGVGGLARTYGNAAQQAILNAQFHTVQLATKLSVELPASHIGMLYALAETEGVHVGKPGARKENLVLMLECPVSRTEEFIEKLHGVTSGKARIEIIK